MSRTQQSLTGAEVLAEIIGAWKRNPVFHVPGEGILEILDALAVRRPEVRLISCRHEGGMAFMADATARFGDEPGLCLAGRAPGALNTCLAIHTAFTDSVPLIMLIGQAPMAHAEREAYLGIEDFHRTLGAMSKWVALVPEASRLPEFMSRAFHVALSGRRGPVVLVLPQDILYQKTDVQVPLAPPAPLHIAPAVADLRRLQELLQAARKPLLIIGGSGWTAQAATDMASFAERQGLPVLAAYRRRDLIDNDCAVYAGELGIGMDPALARRVAAADLLLVVGMRLGELNTLSPAGFHGFSLIEAPQPRQVLIHVHTDAGELNRVYRSSLAMNATPPEIASALAALPKVVSGDPWQGWRQSARSDREAFVSGGSCPGSLDLKAVFRQLRDRLPDDAILTSGAGGYALWPQRYVTHRRFGTQAAPKSGAMGYGLPAAIGLKLCNPDRTVVAVAGDGCLLMHGEELATAVQYRVRVVVLVVNNNAYGAIRLSQQRMFGRVQGVDLHSPDFAAYARAFGAHGECVTATAGFIPALERALLTDGPALIELRTGLDTIRPAP